MRWVPVGRSVGHFSHPETGPYFMASCKLEVIPAQLEFICTIYSFYLHDVLEDKGRRPGPARVHGPAVVLRSVANAQCKQGSSKDDNVVIVHHLPPRGLCNV